MGGGMARLVTALVFLAPSLLATVPVAWDSHSILCSEQMAGNSPVRSRFTARLSDAERRSVSERTAAIPDGEAAALARALERASGWDDLRCEPERCALTAMAAYERGLVPVETVATLLWRDAALETFRPPEARRRAIPIVNESGRPSDWLKLVCGSDPGALTEPQWHVFLERLSALPPSERVAWSFPKTGLDSAYREADTMLGTFLALAFRPVDPAGEPERDGIVLPSFGVLRAWLAARHGDRAITLFPELGRASSWDLLEDLAEGGRAFALPFPGLRGVEKADGIVTGPFFAAVHDFSHAHFGSGHSLPAYRRAFLRIARLMDDYAREWAPSRLPRGLLTVEEARYWRFRFGDVSLPSAGLFHEGPEPSIADSIQADFGASPESRWHVVPALLLEDMVRDPGYWAALGMDPRRFSARMGAGLDRWNRLLLPEP